MMTLTNGGYMLEHGYWAMPMTAIGISGRHCLMGHQANFGWVVLARTLEMLGLVIQTALRSVPTMRGRQAGGMETLQKSSSMILLFPLLIEMRLVGILRTGMA